MVDRRGDHRLDRGQATVEAVVVLPVIVVVLLALVQVGLVLRDHVAVTTAARAGELRPVWPRRNRTDHRVG